MNREKKEKHGKQTKINLWKFAAIILLIIFSIICIKNKSEKSTNITGTIDSELARTMTYEQFEDADFATDSDYVTFGAFFLRDLDGDGYSEKIAGTCKEIGTTDTLYINLTIGIEGEFTNGVITINGTNFTLKTAIVKDSIVTNNEISNNTTQIELNTVSAGTNKLLMGTIIDNVSTEADYSKINSVTLTGTYIDSNGNEIPIEKTIYLTVDWYGEIETEITTTTETLYADEIIDEEEETITVSTTIVVEDTLEELILKESYVSGTIPELNGYKATSVTLEGSNRRNNV